MKSFASLVISLVILLFVIYACMAVNVPSANGATDHAYSGNADSCGTITVSLPTEAPACSSGISPAGTTSYGNTVKITVQHDITTPLSLYWDSFWCPDGQNYCTKNKHETPFSYPKGLKAGTYSFAVGRPSDNGLACGSIQTDFWFTYNNGKCGSHYNGGFGYGAWGYCKLWNGQMANGNKVISCASQPKPTPQISIVIKPFSAPAATPTPTQPTATGCNNIQNGNRGSANNNCNINTNTQTQAQTQNNFQTVTVTSISQPVQAPAPQVMAAATSAPELPSTGTPFDQFAFLFGMFPTGLLLRKWTKH